MQVSSMFDYSIPEVSKVEFNAELDFEDRPWNIGLIVGPSGSGKSSLARKLWGDIELNHKWSSDKAIIDDFDSEMDTSEIVGLLTSVGFGSPPSWCRPYRALSTGEQFRVDIARSLSENKDITIVDEFTSTVDRQVAKVASHTIQKSVRRAEKKLVAVTCHYDVIEWLQPDWIYNTIDHSFLWRSLRRHPELELKVAKISRSAWGIFSKHHYLNGDINTSASCFGAWIGDDLVAFTSYIHFPHPKTRNIKMGHRLVVLPDYQGLGIAGRLDDWLGHYLFLQGFRYHNTVSHPAMIRYYLRSPRWKYLNNQTLYKKPVKKGDYPKLKARHNNPRVMSTQSFAYIEPKHENKE